MVRLAQRRRYKLRNGARGLGATLGPLLEEPPVRLNEETRLRIEAWIIGGIITISLGTSIVGMVT